MNIAPEVIVIIIINLIGWAFALGVAHQKGKSGKKLLDSICLKISEKEKRDTKWQTDFKIQNAEQNIETQHQIKTLDRTINNGLAAKLDKALSNIQSLHTEVEVLKTFHK